MNKLPPLREGCGYDCDDCADEPICGKADFGPCHCTDKQGKEITWRLDQSKLKIYLHTLISSGIAPRFHEANLSMQNPYSLNLSYIAPHST